MVTFLNERFSKMKTALAILLLCMLATTASGQSALLVLGSGLPKDSSLMVKTAVETYILNADVGSRLTIVKGSDHSLIASFTIPESKSPRNRFRDSSVAAGVDNVVRFIDTNAGSGSSPQVALHRLAKTFWSYCANEIDSTQVFVIGDMLFNDPEHPFWSFTNRNIPSDASFINERSSNPFVQFAVKKIPASAAITLIPHQTRWTAPMRHERDVIRAYRLAATHSIGGHIAAVRQRLDLLELNKPETHGFAIPVVPDGSDFIGVWHLSTGSTIETKRPEPVNESSEARGSRVQAQVPIGPQDQAEAIKASNAGSESSPIAPVVTASAEPSAVAVIPSSANGALPGNQVGESTLHQDDATESSIKAPNSNSPSSKLNAAFSEESATAETVEDEEQLSGINTNKIVPRKRVSRLAEKNVSGLEKPEASDLGGAANNSSKESKSTNEHSDLEAKVEFKTERSPERIQSIGVWPVPSLQADTIPDSAPGANSLAVDKSENSSSATMPIREPLTLKKHKNEELRSTPDETAPNSPIQPGANLIPEASDANVTSVTPISKGFTPSLLLPKTHAATINSLVETNDRNQAANEQNRRRFSQLIESLPQSQRAAVREQIAKLGHMPTILIVRWSGCPHCEIDASVPPNVKHLLLRNRYRGIGSRTADNERVECLLFLEHVDLRSYSLQASMVYAHRGAAVDVTISAIDHDGNLFEGSHQVLEEETGLARDQVVVNRDFNVPLSSNVSK